MQRQKVRINGQDIVIPQGTTTKELGRMIDLDGDHFLAEQNEHNESTQILDRNSRLPQKTDLSLVTLPRYRQGICTKTKRIQNEITIISSRFPVLFDEDNLNYVSIMNFPLNLHFNFRVTTLLIKIPNQYPFTPPEHFYLKKGLLYKGRPPEHYFQGAGFNDLDSHGWSKYCLHVTSWKPSVDIISGDSLITFLELIKLVFDNIEREAV